MNIDITKLPKKLNEICYFKKEETGTTIYNYSNKNKADVVIIKLEDTEIENNFAILGSTLDMVRKLNPVKSVEIKEEQFIIKSAKGTFKGKLLNETLPLYNLSVKNEIKANLKALKVLSGFTATNDRKPILEGINLKSDGTMVATDSFKLARYKSVEKVDTEDNITIPKTFVDLIKSEITDDEVVLKYNDNTVILEKENITYVSGLLAGVYPSVDRLFNPSSLTIEYDTHALKEAISLSKNVGIDNNGEKYLSLTFENGKIVAEGVSTFETNIDDNKEEYRFTIQADVLELVLNNITDEITRIGYTAYNRPLNIESNSIEYLLLPIVK